MTEKQIKIQTELIQKVLMDSDILWENPQTDGTCQDITAFVAGGEYGIMGTLEDGFIIVDRSGFPFDGQPIYEIQPLPLSQVVKQIEQWEMLRKPPKNFKNLDRVYIYR